MDLIYMDVPLISRSRRYSASETVLKSLKSQQQDVHNMVGTTLREIQALKSSNSTAIASINSLLDQDSQYEHRQEIRSLVTDLQETASKCVSLCRSVLQLPAC